MSEQNNYPVGKCNCLTKTPDPSHHDVHCPIYLWAEVNAKQAQIDELMWEYCPDDMTSEQIAEYEKHQKVLRRVK